MLPVTGKSTDLIVSTISSLPSPFRLSRRHTFSPWSIFTADGFTHRELKDYVEKIRKKLLSLQYVGKITTIGEQDEKYYVEFSPHRLAKLGISQNAVISAIQQQNALTPSGTVDTDSDKIAIDLHL